LTPCRALLKLVYSEPTLPAAAAEDDRFFEETAVDRRCVWGIAQDRSASLQEGTVMTVSTPTRPARTTADERPLLDEDHLFELLLSKVKEGDAEEEDDELEDDDDEDDDLEDDELDDELEDDDELDDDELDDDDDDLDDLDDLDDDEDDDLDDDEDEDEEEVEKV